ncbi:nitroreductase family deazaflavin-dependent oxidoreductase [Herbiconiux sp. CPCC 203407]|uniref:Nitroreductase family deazaflavin-dependent oxidoreductase n=1 Tax=Herbiconiux oxytropis TaxID=2970915 RepID=A0AA41XJ86_9MICO|nr:nitroreductase family deazaflavin-dependent oxidoreductase [Herbiconiux oxytropis]MCS5723574.1 nitroreductase family deazaflavin-dependent oxidoreductase [Herbiconiux oxytropis]MCS5727500.1 nitroreductase family deazaflavin-dependent oxidoreductase [Herbiconiux oxytropis]
MASLQRGIRRAVARFSRSRFFRRFGPAVMPPLERVWKVLNRGGRPLSGVLVPSLVLHTTGARSGLPRSTELMYCPEPDGALLVTGSNFAGENHPAWSANLIAHPDAVVEVGRRSIRVRAELVGDDEREAVWAFIEAQWPGYRGYERASGRTLRIFRLTRMP